MTLSEKRSNRVKGFIAFSGLNKDDVSIKMKMSPKTLDRRIDHPEEMTIQEFMRMAKISDLSHEAMIEFLMMF